MIDTIILAAKFNNDSSLYDALMVPIHGKPAIDYVISNLQDYRRAVVVVNKHNHNIQCYLKKNYPFLKQSIIDSNDEENKYGINSILNSLNNGLFHIEDSESLVRVVLGDTVCKITGLPENDLVLTSKDFDTSERWCLIDLDKENKVNNFYDKKNVDTVGKHVLVGFYQFTNIKILKEIVLNKLLEKCCNISDVLKEYSSLVPIYAMEVEQWYDLGHKSGIVKAQNSFFNSREFNSLYVDAIKGTITKISNKKEKLEDENYWYNNFPKEIQALVPRVFSYEQNINNASLTMELYGYQALSELFILGNMTLEEWKLILNRLFETHNLLKSYTGIVCVDELRELYCAKTKNRMDLLKQQSTYWQYLMSYEYIIINDVQYRNIRFFEDIIFQKIEDLLNSSEFCVMHGDFCLSNILFDTTNFVCKLIDPRGRLKSQTIYGDARYDIAKLRHSIVGKYDYVVHGLYDLQESDNNFTYSEAFADYQEKLSVYFDKLVLDNGFNLDEIKFIEALLFLSMIPLHKDSFDRQKAFYLKAVMKFNEIFEE